MKKTYGYKPDIVDIRDNIFGSNQTPNPIILESGNWNTLFIQEEFQAEKYETYSCVIHTILNGIEKLAKLQFNADWNKSERFTYIASETDPTGGNSPRTVANSIRKLGTIDENELHSNVNTLEEYNSPRPLTKELLEKAKPFLRDYEFRYDFLPLTGGQISIETMREALKRSTIGIAVFAWSEKNGKYTRQGNDTHLTLLTNVKDNGELEVFDSYAPAHKTLEKDYPIYVGIRFYIRKKTEEEKEQERKLSILEKLLDLMKQLLILMGLMAAKKTEEQKMVESISDELPPPAKPIIEIIRSKAWCGGLLEDRKKMFALAQRICLEEKLSEQMTKDLLATIYGESGFNQWCVNEVSKDYGLCQFSAKYYLKEYNMTPNEAITNPEKCLRIMCRNWATRKSNWVAYSNGSYKKYYNKLNDFMV